LRHYFRQLLPAFSLQPSILSAVKIHAPALLLSLYIFSFWILPQGWNEDNPLDGSWRYAFGKFRGLGFSLGKDSWFTYGPLAHWFGAPIGTEQYQPFPYYVLGFLVAGIIGISFSRILATIDLSYRLRIITVFIFPFCFIGMDGVQEIHLIIALFLLLVSCCLQETPDNVSIISMIILSACGLLYKISFGILSAFTLVLLLVSLLVRRKISGTKIVLFLTAYMTILYLLFVVTSGSYDLFTYILLGLETSSKYSEIMIRNMPYSPPNYIIALVYIAAGGILAWQASKKTSGRAASLCLMTVYLGTMFLLYKHGFVRADLSHMKLFYSSVTPFLAILAVISFSGFKTKVTSERVLLCSAALILFVIYLIMLKFLPGNNSTVNLAKNWLTSGNRIVAGMKGQSPEEFPAKVAFIKNSQPQLFSFLNGYARTFGAKGRKPRITFYPWELINFEGLEGFDLAPSPSLQLYSTGPHSRAHRLEAEFLSSEHRPDIVVIGPGSIDARSPVSELTDLLPPLYSHYRVAVIVDGFTILEANESGKSTDRVIRYTEKPQETPGEFLRISFDQPEVVNRLLWRLAATLFKSPELHVTVTITYANNEKLEYIRRGYLSQLQGGVFYSPYDIPNFFWSTFRISPQVAISPFRGTIPIKSAVAELWRSGGFWNLPIIPRVVPLKVEYCSFVKITIQSN
jgi:hypothetical protein